MRLAWLGLVLAGCSTSTVDPCGGLGDVCVVARVEGNVTGLDQLRFSITQPSALSTVTPASPTSFSLPVRVGLVLPAGSSGSIALTLDGISNGSAIAEDVENVAISGNRGSVTFTLNTGSAPDLSIPSDLAADMAKPAINVLPAGPIMGAELDPLRVDVSANDPAGEPLTISLTSLPPGATTSGDGGVASLTWTPAADQAGSHDIKINVMPMDNTRAFTETLTLNIANVLDPIFPAPGDVLMNSPFPPANFVGDFDGDGFADIASCSVAIPAATEYTVTLVYGAAAGLPTTPPAPPRSKQIKFSIGSSPGPNQRLQCLGGDFNGDGKSDVLLVDPAANTNAGMAYIVFGTDRASNSLAIPAFDTTTNIVAPGDNFGGGNVVVGDFDGDGKDDFFVTTAPSAPKDTIFKFLGKTIVMAPAPAFFTAPTLDTVPAASPAPCSPHRQLMSMGDADNDAGHHQELLVYDGNIGSGSCAMRGGMTLFNSNGAPTTTYARPVGAPSGFGGNGAPSMLCDVDGDGFADLVVVDSNTAGFAWVWYSTAGVFPTVTGALDGTAATKLQAPASHLYALVKCAHKFQPGMPDTALIVDPGNTTTVPASVSVLAQARPTSIARALVAPLGDINYGSAFGGTGDANGDGRSDVIIGAVGAGGMAGKFWVIYGK